MHKGELTGSWECDGATVALLEVASDGGTEWIAAEPSMADDLLTPGIRRRICTGTIRALADH